MNTTTAASIASSSVSHLQGYIQQLFTSLAPWAIAIAVLFVGFLLLKNLWHRHL